MTRYTVSHPLLNVIYIGCFSDCLHWLAVQVNPFKPESVTMAQAYTDGYRIKLETL